MLPKQTRADAIGTAASSRDPIVGPERSERSVWEYPILAPSMAALVKSAALPKDRSCTREGMLRQQSQKN